MVTLKFHDKYLLSRNLQVEAKNYKEDDDEFHHITLKINFGYNHDYEFINLDKSTAIKFSKELRKQIARIDDAEGI